MIELKELVQVPCGKDVIVTCGDETIGYISFGKDYVTVNSVFKESGKKYNSTDEAMRFLNRTLRNFINAVAKKN
jgi:hypothetical protein